MTPILSTSFTLKIASELDRKDIYKIRHAIYAKELKQHHTNNSYELSDSLDSYNHYIVAKDKEKIIGFVSLTPPNSRQYSFDKYFSRDLIPFHIDDYVYEVRLLTVLKPNRNSGLALALMFAAFRWVQSHGGRHIVSICRSDILNMYKKVGLCPLNSKTISGQVSYDLCVGEMSHLDIIVQNNKLVCQSIQRKVNWQLTFAFFKPSDCYHGGAFFQAIGEDLQNLHKAKDVITADVLDAWFPPSPQVLEVLQKNLSWLLQTSPPTHAGGLISVIAAVRGIKEACILPGAGSSNLIFLAFRTFLTSHSKVLIIDPCYGEYIHVLENLLHCSIARFKLSKEHQYSVDVDLLSYEIQKGYDMVILVNPNSPTGVYLPKIKMLELIKSISPATLVWIDETYIEYAGSNETLEILATQTENVLICKSMSKVYALSGVRAAYLCGSRHLLETLKSFTPPWSISLPAQAAAIMALRDETYYLERYAETRKLRKNLKSGLLNIGIPEVMEGVANFLLFFLPKKWPKVTFLQHCKDGHLYLRDVSNMGRSLGENAIRIAVKDEETNKKMIAIIKKVIEKLEADNF